MKPLHIAIAATLPLVGWLAFVGETPTDATIVEPTVAMAASKSKATQQSPQQFPANSQTLLGLRDRKSYIRGPDASMAPQSIFDPYSWTPPPLALPAPPPPAPSAPPLPFIYLGKKLEAGRWEVYLAHGDAMMIAHEKSTIADIYRVDSIRPPLLQLTYLPLNEAQNLSIGATE